MNNSSRSRQNGLAVITAHLGSVHNILDDCNRILGDMIAEMAEEEAEGSDEEE